MTNQKKLCIILSIVSICLVSGAIFGWFINSLGREYDEYDKLFTETAKAAVPKFAELNNTVLAKLPPPKGVKLISQSNIQPWSPLGSPMYEVYLDVEYEIKNTTTDEIVTYYKNLFHDQNWQEYRTKVMSNNHYEFFHETAHVQLYFYVSKYRIAIEHDFWNQDFSPPKPAGAIRDLWCLTHPECSSNLTNYYSESAP
jgi:hypothetical protein